jgi:hypothetical protein
MYTQPSPLSFPIIFAANIWAQYIAKAALVSNKLGITTDIWKKLTMIMNSNKKYTHLSIYSQILTFKQ